MPTFSKRYICVLALVLPPSGIAWASDDYTPPKVYTTTPGGVNLSDGSFVYSSTDISIGSLKLERFHLGGLKDPANPYFGPRMSHNFDIYVARNVTGAVRPSLPERYKPIVHMGSSASGTYEQDMSGDAPSASSQDAGSGTLDYPGGAYVYTSQDGTVYTFNPAVAAAGALGGSGSQRVANIVYPGGRTLTFSYDANGLLKLISDTAGYALVFEYSGSVVSAACGYDLASTYITDSSTCSGASIKSSYGYTNGLLTSVTDVLGNTTNYSYSGSEIACVQPPGYTSCKISNSYGSAAFQVAQQTLSDGSVWKFSYSGDYVNQRDPNKYLVEDPTNTTTVTDPLNQTETYAYSATSPYTFTDANSHVTQYRYTGGYDQEGSLYPTEQPMLANGTLLVESDLPVGNKYLAEYGPEYNAVTKETFVPASGSNLANVVIQYNYASCVSPRTRQNCTKPIAKIDPNGNETDYTYFDFGATQTEMQPAPQSGTARPLKIYGYSQMYAYIQSGSGGLVQAASPIWMPTSETDCQTVAGSSSPACDSNAPQVVTTYEYATAGTGDNLLPRGKVVTSAGVSLRSCYSYDGQGNKISETSPRAGLASCS